MAASTHVGIPDFDAILDKMGATKAADPTDPAGLEDLRFAQGSLRKMVRSMDRVLGAAEAIAEAGEKSGWDRMAITGAIRSWNGQLGKVYGDFTSVRSRMYSMSKSFGISTRRPSVKRKGRKNVYQMTESELEKDLRRLVKALRPALREVAEKGAMLLSEIDRTLKKPSIGLTQADRLTKHFLDFRDAVGGKMFGMINGIVKRLDARSKLARRTALQAHDETPWYMESRDPRHMSEEDLLAYSERRDRQRSLGGYALVEKKLTVADLKRGTTIVSKSNPKWGEWKVTGKTTHGGSVWWDVKSTHRGHSKTVDISELGDWQVVEDNDVFAHFDEIDDLTERVSDEPVQRAKDRMAASLARGDTKKMVKDASTRIKRMTNRAKLKGMVAALTQIIAEPGLSLTSGQKTALQTLQKMAKLKLGENYDVFSHFDQLTERQIVSKEPVQRAKDRMAAALMRGDTRGMIKATSLRIKKTTNRAKLRGIVVAIDQLIKEPGMSLRAPQKQALLTVQKQAQLKLGESLASRLSKRLQERGAITTSSVTEALRRNNRPSIGQARLAAERHRSLGEYALDEAGSREAYANVMDHWGVVGAKEAGDYGTGSNMVAVMKHNGMFYAAGVGKNFEVHKSRSMAGMKKWMKSSLGLVAA